MAQELEERVLFAASEYDAATAQEGSDELIEALDGGDLQPDFDSAKAVLKSLRSARYFDLLVRVAGAYRRHPALSGQLTSLLVQGLIEQKELSRAISVAKEAQRQLDQLPPEETEDEAAELAGLLGRAYKQRYVDRYGTAKVRESDLLSAIDQYRTQEPEKRWWHGVNAVACVARATRDRIEVPGLNEPYDFVKMTAEAIRKAIAARPVSRIDVWDLATATECSLAIYLQTHHDQDLSEIRKWLNRYVKYRGGNAFEYNSTLRQLVEVWQLKPHELPGSEILPVLEGELLRHEGAFIETLQADLGARRRALSSAVSARITGKDLQARFGREGAIRFKEWKKAESRAYWVCKIHPYDDELNVKGTGFLIRGDLLADWLKPKYYVLTNDHVVSRDPTPYQGAPNGMALVPLAPDQAFVSCELADVHNLGVKGVVSCSWYGDLDFALLELEQVFRPTLQQVPELAVSSELPPVPKVKEQAQRLYVIGYPGGAELAFSMSDNFIIDHEGPPGGNPDPPHRVRLHYRSPTWKGSSGSPVFDQKWDLVGLHHAGGMLRQLNSKPGEHFANEGIWIQSIRALLRPQPAGGGAR